MQLESIDFTSILRRIRKNISILVGATGITMLLGFATVALNARALGADGVGIIALFQASAGLFAGLLQVGSQQPMIRLGRQALEDGRRDRVGILAGLAIFVDTSMAFLAGILALIVIWFMPDFIGLPDELVMLAYVYSAVIFFSGISASSGILRLLDKFYCIGLMQVASALMIFMTAAALSVIDATLGAYIILYAAIFSLINFSQLLIAMYFLQKSKCGASFSFKKLRAAGIFREYFAYAWTTSCTSTIDTVRRNGDTIFLGAFWGPSVVGVYAVVKQLSAALSKVMVPMSSAIFPEVAALAAKEERLQARRLLNRLALIGAVLGLFGLFSVIIVGPWILTWVFGPTFTEGSAVLIVLVIAVGFNLSGVSFGGFIQAFRSPKELMIIYLWSFALFLICAPVLIVSLGAIGSALGQVIFAMMLWFLSWRLLMIAIPPEPAKLHEFGRVG